MTKKRLTRILAFALMCAALLFAVSAQSGDIGINNDKIAQLQQQAAKIQAENKAREARINDLRGDINKQNEFIREVNTQIKQIEAQIAAYIELMDAKQEMMDSTESAIFIKEAQIIDTEVKIAQREEEIESLDARNDENIEKFGQLVAQMYMNSGNDIIGLLIGSTSFYDILVRTEMIRNIGERNVEFMETILESIERQEELIADLVRDKSKLELERFELAEQNRVYSDEMHQLTAERAEIAAEVERQYSALRKLTAEQANLQGSVNNITKQVSDAKKQLDGIAKNIADLERENERIRDRIRQLDPNHPDYSGDGFMRPVDRSFPLGCRYDCEKDKILCVWCVEKGEKLIGRVHTGLDITGAGINGANIYATQSGTVSIVVTGWGGGYGNYVVINHGGGITSLYAHMLSGSLTVKVGDKVEKGDIIGKVGDTGWSSGPHLHFEIRKDGTAVNPLNYIS